MSEVDRFYERFEAREANGGHVVFTVIEDLLMINTGSICCQFPKDTVIPILDDGGMHGVLRFVDSNYWEMGMTMFIDGEFSNELVMFLQTHTRSRVVM